MNKEQRERVVERDIALHHKNEKNKTKTSMNQRNIIGGEEEEEKNEEDEGALRGKRLQSSDEICRQICLKTGNSMCGKMDNAFKCLRYVTSDLLHLELLRYLNPCFGNVLTKNPHGTRICFLFLCFIFVG